MNGSGRLVTDSPAYKGDLFFIEIPDPKMPGENLVHKISVNINEHQKHMDRLIENGNRNFSERRIRV